MEDVRKKLTLSARPHLHDLQHIAVLFLQEGRLSPLGFSASQKRTNPPHPTGDPVGTVPVGFAVSNNTVRADTLARFGTNLAPLSYDIPRNVVSAALQRMLIGIAGYFHAAGRRMKLPWVPTGIASGSWHFAGRSRGMFL